MGESLDGILVLDLSRLFPGPYCSMILADHGARVIAIENRRFESEFMPMLRHIYRNKEHMTLNLKTQRGKDIFFTLAKKADVVLEGFRPGVMDRLGVGYNDLKQINPDIIYCAVTGYGQTGPLKDLPGHDVNYLGQSGVLSVIGPKNGAPCIPGIPIADTAGGLNAAIGILMALYFREKTGKGQYIDISLTDTAIAMLPVVAGMRWAFGTVPERGDALLSHRYACYSIYRTKDDKYLTLGALEPRFWESVCRYFGKPEFIPIQFDDSRREELIAFFQNTFEKKTRDEWTHLFCEREVCIGSVLDVDEVLNSEYTKSRQMAVELESSTGSSVSMLGIPINLSESRGAIRHLPPNFGQNTRSVLTELGFSNRQIQEMENDGVV